MKQKTIVEVAVELSKNPHDYITVEYLREQFKSCIDFPRIPEVVECEIDARRPVHPDYKIFTIDQKLYGKKWRVVATEIME